MPSICRKTGFQFSHVHRAELIHVLITAAASKMWDYSFNKNAAMEFEHYPEELLEMFVVLRDLKSWSPGLRVLQVTDSLVVFVPLKKKPTFYPPDTLIPRQMTSSDLCS